MFKRRCVWGDKGHIHSSEYVQEHCFSNFSTEVPIMAEETKYGDLVKYG